VEEWEPSLAELRSRYGAGVSDEELILRVYVGDEARNVLRRPLSYAATYEEYLRARGSLPELVARLADSCRASRVTSIAWTSPDREISIVRAPDERGAS
ncbi:MAG: hypothetical protein ACRDYD_13895, partial [Acidimicrobiales bacterium]